MKIEISVPKKLQKKLKEEVKKTKFESIEEYILCLLKQIVTDSEAEEVYTKEEQLAFHENPTNEEEEKKKLKLKKELRK